MKDTIIVDIDGTVSKVGDRIKYLQQKRKDWDSFYDHCDEDEAFQDIIDLIESLHTSGYNVVFCTGRRESVRDKTKNWLSKHFWLIHDYTLLMRKDGDFRHDTEIKPELIKSMNLTPDNVLFILEDRDSMVTKWRELGYRCLQVADGNF